MTNKEKIGGRAYRNGVRLMDNKYSVKAYYDKMDNLQVEINRVKENKYYKYIKKIPILRGIFSLFLAVVMFLKEVTASPKKYWFIFVIIIADLIFMILPESAAGRIGYIEDIYLIFYFSLPLLLLFIFRDEISDVLKFHGAEHKAVNYYENNYSNNIDFYSRIHRRCGSNIVFYYFIITFIFSFLDFNLNFFFQELLFLGFAYEAIKYTPDRLLFFPSLFQRIVTREPDERQLKAASLALKVLTDQK